MTKNKSNMAESMRERSKINAMHAFLPFCFYNCIDQKKTCIALI